MAMQAFMVAKEHGLFISILETGINLVVLTGCPLDVLSPCRALSAAAQRSSASS
jgi:hypothetical protein